VTVNRVVLTGKLAADPELTTLPSGETLCEIRLAVDAMGADGEAGYVQVKQYGNSGHTAVRLLGRGAPVAIEGRLQHRRWETAGAQVETFEIIGRIGVLGHPRTSPTPSLPSDDDDFAIAF
jgi:single-strand DNA-binding protein